MLAAAERAAARCRRYTQCRAGPGAVGLGVHPPHNPRVSPTRQFGRSAAHTGGQSWAAARKRSFEGTQHFDSEIGRPSAITGQTLLAREGLAGNDNNDSGSRHLVADRTYRLLLDANHQSKSIGFAFDAVQNQDVGSGQQSLRMARGRCHRSQSLKHSNHELFRQRLHQKCGRAQI